MMDGLSFAAKVADAATASAASGSARFALPMSPAGRSALKALKIEASFAGQMYGDPGAADFKRWVARCLQEMGNDPADCEQAVDLVSDIARLFASAFSMRRALVHLRGSTPNHTYDAPRWHSDGHYDVREEGTKMVVALRGAGTLFGTVPASRRSEFDALEGLEWRAEGLEQRADVRRRKDALVQGRSKLGALEAGVYRVGGAGAAIHSEPPVPRARLFLAVLPGKAATAPERWPRFPK
jgi:hypothetical protein